VVYKPLIVFGPMSEGGQIWVFNLDWATTFYSLCRWIAWASLKIQPFIIERSWHLGSTSQVEGHTYFPPSMARLWSFNKCLLSNHFARYDWMHVPTLQANLVPTLTHPMFSFVILSEIRGVCFQGTIVVTTNNINHTMHLPSTLVGIATMTKFKSSNTYAGIAIT